jgi:hypothetical protein
MPARPWLKRELDYVLAHRGRLKLGAIAARLGRTRAAVVNVLAYYGLSARKTPRSAWESLLRRLHALGWTDPCLAARLGCSREEARRRRVSLGLPPNPVPEAVRKARYRKACRTMEARNLADVKHRKARVARLLGGP